MGIQILCLEVMYNTDILEQQTTVIHSPLLPQTHTERISNEILRQLKFISVIDVI